VSVLHGSDRRFNQQEKRLHFNSKPEVSGSLGQLGGSLRTFAQHSLIEFHSQHYEKYEKTQQIGSD